MHTFSTRILFLNKISGLIRVGLVAVALFLVFPSPSFEGAEENRVLDIVKKMESSLKTVEDYTCKVEQIFYQYGEENQRYRFKFYFKRRKKIRVDFSYPYSSLTILYKKGDKEATVLPFRSLPTLKFRFSINNPIILTPAGQRIDQTDMDFFIKFLLGNLERVNQQTEEFYEDNDQVKFWLRALDYIGGKDLERYRIFISKHNWLPLRIERYDSEGKPLEVTIFQNYVINSGLDEKLFVP